MKVNLSDTICAIATAPGGAISLIRMSGGGAVEILRKVFPCREFLERPESHRVYYGFIGGGGYIADEALVTLMLAPRSFTMEDVVEISCHGGTVSAGRVLELLLLNGARLAERGEFTKRAFLNGRLDLIQAEAVCGIIGAKSGLAQKIALNQLRGGASREIISLRDKLMRSFANIEASIDYPENDIEEISAAELRVLTDEMITETERLIRDADTGELIKEGVDAVILGKPNVGKSSLMNALLGYDRAIVTETAGTTRDIVREHLSFGGGVTLRLSDTAGIRETDDLTEGIGVGKSLNAAETAGLIFAVLDNSEELSPEDIEILRLIQGKKAIVLVNKSDKPRALDIAALKSRTEAPILEISAKSGDGLDKLSGLIKSLIFMDDIDENSSYITGERRKAALIEAKKSLMLARETLAGGLSTDFAVVDLENAYRSLGEITGDSIDDDICDKIFSEFCLGK